LISWDQEGDHWIVDPAWIKNAGQGSRLNPHPMTIPVCSNDYIRFYLDVIRPALMKQSTDAFWINSKGSALSGNTCREYIKSMTNRTTGKEINPRLMRLNINSHFFDAGPHDPQEQMDWNYSMNHSPQTEAEYYRLWASERDAHRKKHGQPFLVSECSLSQV